MAEAQAPNNETAYVARFDGDMRPSVDNAGHLTVTEFPRNGGTENPFIHCTWRSGTWSLCRITGTYDAP